ncbi:hypothetical protein K492DRAFT_192953 [Lichtheimia hyalospora FSU 10163]|nr:hypothetical protein K492DRAFT_192953 [Lichtheimia hyalospora FSU 10163]
MVNDVEISGLAAVFAAVGFVIIVIVCVRQIARQSKNLASRDEIRRRRQRRIQPSSTSHSHYRPNEDTCSVSVDPPPQYEVSMITPPPPAYTEQQYQRGL